MRLTLNDGTEVKPGDVFTNGFMGTRVTFVRVSSEPWGVDEGGEYCPGQIVVREAWGSETTVLATKLRPMVQFREDAVKGIDPSALAKSDPDDTRPGTVDVDEAMILDYVYTPDGPSILHVRESAEAFAAWANALWFEYHDGEDNVTNKDVLDGMLADWRGNVGD